MCALICLELYVCGIACFDIVFIYIGFSKLRVFENKVLRRVFGPKRDEVTGECSKLHNEELHDLYSSPTVVRVITSRRMRWVGHVAGMGEGRGVYRVLVGKH
jgi:hypothetical protein